MAAWQPRDDKGRFKSTGLAEEAARSGRSIKQLADVAAQAGVKIEALAKAFKKIRAVEESTKAMDAARKSLGMMTKAEQQAAKAGAAEMAEAEATAICAVEAAAAAAAAAVIALAAATASLMHTAIEVVEQREEWLELFNALGKGPNAGKATLAMLDDLAKELPFAQTKIVEWAKSLEAAGIHGENLKEAIKATAAATAIMGESGGAAAEKMLKQLAEGGEAASKMMKQIQAGGPKSAKLLADMGLQTTDLAEALGVSEDKFNKMNLSAEQMSKAIEKALAKKGAGPLANMGDDLSTIALKFREGLLSLFEKLGPSVGAFKKALAGLFGQFGRGTPTIKALQKVVTEVFGALFKYGTMAVQAISKFIKQNVNAKSIGSAWKSVKETLATIGKVLGVVWTMMKPIVTSSLFLKGIVTVFKVIAVVVFVVVGALGALVAVMTIVVGFVGTIGTLLWGLIGTLLGWGAAAVEAGANFVSGLVSGITGGAGAVVDAVKSLASSAVGAFKAALGIASPSKVMAKMGGFAGAGAAQGLDQSAGKVEDSAAQLGAGVQSGAARGMSGAGGKGGAGRSITFASGAITINAGSAHIDEEKLAIALERLLAAQGL